MSSGSDTAIAPPPSSTFGPTALGIMSIIFWSSSVAFSRSLTEQLGTVTSGALIYGISGAVSTFLMVINPRKRAAFHRLSWLFKLGCGLLVVTCIVSFNLAVGLSANRQQVVEIGIINYLWCSLTLALSIPIQNRKAHPAVAIGMLLAFAGVILAMARGSGLSWYQFLSNFRNGIAPYILAFIAALSWALYSNLSRRWGKGADGWSTPVFLLATGTVLLILRVFVNENTTLSPRALAELLYTILFPAFLGYQFWEVAMRRGRVILVASLAYFTPILSTFISSHYLGITIGSSMWLACGMVVAGAVICKLSISENDPAGAAESCVQDMPSRQ